MVSSGAGTFGQPRFDSFMTWMERQPRTLFPQDFLFFDCGRLHWLYIWQQGMILPEGLEVVDFPGGLYAVATDIDGQTDMQAITTQADAFLSTIGLCRDASRQPLGNILTSPRAKAVLGYEQMDYYFPVKENASIKRTESQRSPSVILSFH